MSQTANSSFWSERTPAAGKLTLLRLIAGLEEADRGDIYIGERLANDVPPKDRDIAMVFQNHALLSATQVRRNIAFSLSGERLPRV